MLRTLPIRSLTVLCIFSHLTNAQDFRCPANVSRQSFHDLDPFREAFPDVDVSEPSGSPWLGHQNYTYCCILALNEYVGNECANSSDVWVSGLYTGAQFPCGAEWNGNQSGAPLVQVSYDWSKHYCPGWQISSASNLTQWLQLLVGFILPAVVFILNIPRRRKIAVSDSLFPEDISNYRIITAGVGAAIAMLTVMIDTAIWLLTVFAVAGPLLLSGLYEARLDKRVLSFLDEKDKSNRLPIALRVRMLFTILCGNLELYPAWCDTMQLASMLDALDEFAGQRPCASSDVTQCQGQPQSGLKSSPTTDSQDKTEVDPLDTTIDSQKNDIHVEVITKPDSLESSVQTDTSRSTEHADAITEGRNSQSDHPCTDNAELVRDNSQQCHPCCSQKHSSNGTHDQDDHREESYPQEAVNEMSSCLTAMLDCQYSFGSVIGAPVLFYIGSFFYALMDMRQNYGSSDAAYALGFGMWWMVIPHIAIVSGLLLGGNNPSALMGIIRARQTTFWVGGQGAEQRNARRQSTFEEFKMKGDTSGLFAKVFKLVYKAAYKPVSMWNRGRSKQRWLLVLCTDSIFRYKEQERLFKEDVRPSMEQLLTETLILSPLEWVYLASVAYSLIVVPCLLGFLLTFWTPQVGLACRSTTFIIYMCAQGLLLVIWTIRMTWRDVYWCHGARIKRYLSSKDEGNLWAALKDLKAMALQDAMNQPPRHSIALLRSKHLTDKEKSGGTPRTNETSTRRQASQWPKYANWIYYFFLFLGFGISIFSGIGGTIMQVTGAYRNNVCKMNANHWLPGHRAGARLQLSSNSAESISRAMGTWTNLGIISVVVLIAWCYIGWWYQRRLRRHFRLVAEKLDRHTGRRVLKVRLRA